MIPNPLFSSLNISPLKTMSSHWRSAPYAGIITYITDCAWDLDVERAIGFALQSAQVAAIPHATE